MLFFDSLLLLPSLTKTEPSNKIDFSQAAIEKAIAAERKATEMEKKATNAEAALASLQKGIVLTLSHLSVFVFISYINVE